MTPAGTTPAPLLRPIRVVIAKPGLDGHDRGVNQEPRGHTVPSG